MDKSKVWGHTELARLYFPGILLKSASAQLSLWIRRDEELLEDLKKAGYRKGSVCLRRARWRSWWIIWAILRPGIFDNK